MDKNRLETQKHVVNLDPTQHPNQNYFTVEDLKWLIAQAEKVERLEEERKGFKEFVKLGVDLDKRIDALIEAQQKEIEGLRIALETEKGFIQSEVKNMVIEANVDFKVHFINDTSFEIKKGDAFVLVTTYVELRSKRTMAVIHKKNTTPFAVYLDNFNIVS